MDFSIFKLNCQSSKWCVGVGSYVANKRDYTDATFLVSEVWNGSTWRIVPIDSPRTYAPKSTQGWLMVENIRRHHHNRFLCLEDVLCIVRLLEGRLR